MFVVMGHPSIERLGPPVRSVPLLLRLQFAVGGPLSQVGWGLLGFGMIFFWVFVMNCQFITWFTFRGEKATTPGVVTGCTRTTMSEGKRRIYAVDYWFPPVNVAEGQENPVALPTAEAESARGHSGRSYTMNGSVATGTQVAVEYLLHDPATSCIQGMRHKAFGAGVIFVVIFPLAGLCMLLPGLIRGRRVSRLLAEGNLGDARLQSRESTNVRVNRRMVFKLTFQFQASDGQSHDVVVRTHEPENVEDEATEKVIYDPFYPESAVMLDALPGSFVVDEMGQIRTAFPRRALGAPLIPGLTILGHGLWLLLG